MNLSLRSLAGLLIIFYIQNLMLYAAPEDGSEAEKKKLQLGHVKEAYGNEKSNDLNDPQQSTPQEYEVNLRKIVAEVIGKELERE